MRVLVLTDAPRTATFARLALDLLGLPHDVVASLAHASLRLGMTRYDAAIVDLAWDAGARALASWISENLAASGIRVVIGGSSPLARDLFAAMALPAATFLDKSCNLLDLKESLGLDRPAPVTHV